MNDNETSEARASVAREQKMLVAALVANGPVPAGFVPGRIQSAARSLYRKRLRSLKHAWPVLATAFMSNLEEQFAEYSASTPMPVYGGGLADGRSFIRWLWQKRTLSDDVRIGAARFDVQFVASSSGIHPRRWPSCRVLFVSQPRRLILFLHLSAGRLISWGIPMGGR